MNNLQEKGNLMEMLQKINDFKNVQGLLVFACKLQKLLSLVTKPKLLSLSYNVTKPKLLSY